MGNDKPSLCLVGKLPSFSLQGCAGGRPAAAMAFDAFALMAEHTASVKKQQQEQRSSTTTTTTLEPSIQATIALTGTLIGGGVDDAAAAAAADQHEQVCKAESRRLLYDIVQGRAKGRGIVLRDYASMEQYLANNPGCFVKHPCTGRGCNWARLQCGASFTDPRNNRQHKRATGLASVCTTAGTVHICDETDCVAYMEHSSSDAVCTVSGRSLGAIVIAAAADARRDTIRAAEVDSIGGAQPPRGGGGFKRPAKRKETPSQPSHNAATTATTVPSSSSKRRSALQATRNAGKRFAPGSAAANMVESRGLRESDVGYGRELVRFALESVSEDSCTAANKWVGFLLFSAQVQKLHSDNFARALASAEEHAERYSTACVNSGRIDQGRFLVHIFGIYYPTFMPLVDRALWIALSNRDDYVRIAAYFTRAVIALWKITECTPCVFSLIHVSCTD